MRAYAVQCFCNPLVPVELRDHEPVGTEVVLEVTRCGVCHSDLHIQQGYYDLGGGKRISLEERGIKPPIVMGHEVLGRLVSKGKHAPIGDDQIGKTFLVYPWLGCGVCETCMRGDEHLCASPAAVGVFRAGGYADACVIPHPKYLIDVSGLEPSLAATYACSGVTAYSALKKIQIDKERDLVLLVGLGGVGLSGLSVALGLGFLNVAVADIDPVKRQLALAYGAKHAIDPRDTESANLLFAANGGLAAAVDFVGAKATADFSIASLRKGGSYTVVGLYGGEITVPLPLAVIRAITIQGSYVGSSKDLIELIGLVKEGLIRPIPVEEVSFESVNEALDRLREGQVKGRLVLAR